MQKLDYNNKQDVKNYLIKKITNKYLFKGKKFYKTLVDLYDIYPSTITKILDNIPKLTYFKDYLRILSFSENDKLNNYIYDKLLKQFREDIENKKNNKPISTLAKWLPRKGRKYDRELNFVNIFVDMLYGKKNRLNMFIKYKKTVADLTRVINPIEINLCNKKHDNIDVFNLTKKNYQTYNKKLQKHDDLKEQLYKANEISIQKMSYNDLINRIVWLYELNDYKKEIYKHEIELLEKYWDRDFTVHGENLEFDIKNKTLVLDINSSMYNSMKKDIIKISLLFLNTNGYLVINKKIPVTIKKSSLFSSLDNILKNIGMSLKTDLSEIESVIINDNLQNKHFVVITEKPCENIKGGISDFQYICYNQKNFKQINNNQYEGNFLINKYEGVRRRLITKIVNNKELEDNFVKNIVMFIILFLFLLITFTSKFV
ncbi:hypothetical protein Catovirus_1_711 [Catovirus CTV1]|uniref:Uncharacterized protein n=1 Tax=Catovirus CTV1 TaxID=1977631 RepID=A0A1V0SAE8_9VIRU|nr:hypothetical protein Catovirus_1_711 [Catovirus CTV1]